jgi:hypothetical protein
VTVGGVDLFVPLKETGMELLHPLAYIEAGKKPGF